MSTPYKYSGIAKLINSGSFEYGSDVPLVKLADDPDVLRKAASDNPFIEEWKDIKPLKKNASLIHLIALGVHEKTGANRNHDAFEEEVCRRDHPTFVKHGSLFRFHKNKDHSKRDGEVRASGLNEKLGRIELLVEADHDKCGDWLSKIERNEKVGFSMGYDAHSEHCSKCGNNAAKPSDRCEHLNRKNAEFWPGKILDDGHKIVMLNKKGVWNDISYVNRPADMIAYDLRKVAGIGGTVEEYMTGSELAEMAGLSGKTAQYRSIINKLSKIQKQIPGASGPGVISVSRTQVSMDPKTADKLRKMEPEKMFANLAKAGCVLPMIPFFKLAMGEQFDDISGAVELAINLYPNAFSHLLESEARAEAVASNTKYAADLSTPYELSDVDEYDLFENFGTIQIPQALSSKLQKAAATTDIFGSGEMLKTACEQDLASAQVLLDEYLSYKIAAISAIEEQRGQELLPCDLWLVLENI